MTTANYLNPDINGNPSPIVINFYLLNQSSAFLQANFFALYNNSSNVLGKDLIDKQDIEIQPQQHRIILSKLPVETQYLGITAAYRNISQAKWRTFITLPSHSYKIRILLNFGSQSIILAKVQKGHVCVRNNCLIWTN